MRETLILQLKFLNKKNRQKQISLKLRVLFFCRVQILQLLEHILVRHVEKNEDMDLKKNQEIR